MDLQIQLDIWIPMRDGVRLYAVIYRPRERSRFPVLLIRSPYSTQHPRYVEWAERFAAHDYAVVMQDCRGRYDSEGKWRPYIDEASDGYDTQQWIGQQDWCDGSIGTFGVSYPGFTQILPAPHRSRYTKALVPIANQEDNYGHLRCNGVLQQQNTMNWVWMGDRTNQNAPKELIDWEQVYRRLPLLTAIDDIAERPFYRQVIRHPNFDDFWKSYSMKGKYPEVETPAYFITGWYDNLLHEVFKCFHGWKHHSRTPECRRLTRLMIGPWPHGQIGGTELFGDIEFGPQAGVDIPREHLRWYDQRLRGIDSGIDDEPPVSLFVMGANVWRREEEWPLPQTQYTRFYLHSGGRASSLNGDGGLSRDEPSDEPLDTFYYDPQDPVPTVGGQSMFPLSTGPRDRRTVEGRDDVLIYSSPPLEEDLEVTGHVQLTLYASSTSPDTDFTATLVDVHNSGLAIHICEGIVRARFRESYENPILIEPNEVYRFQISLWETSNLFKSGHCIRLEISSSNFPRFDRNLNTGNDAATDTEINIARQAVLHNTRFPSHLALPLIPR